MACVAPDLHQVTHSVTRGYQWQEYQETSRRKVCAWQHTVSLSPPPSLTTSFTLAKLSVKPQRQISAGRVDYTLHWERRNAIDWVLDDVIGQHLSWSWNDSSSDWIWFVWVQAKAKMKGGGLVPLSRMSCPENKRKMYWLPACFASLFIFILPVPAFN